MHFQNNINYNSGQSSAVMLRVKQLLSQNIQWAIQVMKYYFVYFTVISVCRLQQWILGWMVNDELERILKDAIMEELRYYNQHLAAGTEKKHISQDSWWRSQVWTKHLLNTSQEHYHLTHLNNSWLNTIFKMTRCSQLVGMWRLKTYNIY